MEQEAADNIRQIREIMQQYNKVSDLCFGDCIHDFTKPRITEKEQTCALSCMEKYLKMTARVAQRFQEHQAIESENAASNVTPPPAKKTGWFR